MNIYIKKRISILLIIALFLTGCKSVKIAQAVTSNMQDLPNAESMILLAEEKNKYEQRFGRDIWVLKNGDGTQNFSDLIKSNVKKFVEKIILINLMGDKYNIVVNEKDREIIDELANEYYNGLTNDDIDFIKCTLDNVKDLYLNFHKARLTIDHITKNANVELSISESKVIKVQYIEFDDYETASYVATSSQARGANFAYFAKQYTKNKDNEIEKIVMRGDEFSKPFPEIFYLGNGQVTDILKHENKYYIFKCLNDYMVKETDDRKKDILKKLKEDAFQSEYEKFESENPVKVKGDFWNKIDMKGGEGCTVHNFYDLYYKYFPFQ